MTRLIDADALLCALDLNHMTEAEGYKMDLMRSDIKAAINDAPTVDAVEVVRCKDCMLATRSDFGDAYIFCKKRRANLWPDDFCSGGFKR